MFIGFNLEFSYVILLYIAFLYFAEKNKAVRANWKPHMSFFRLL